VDAIWIIVLIAVAIIIVGGIVWYGRQRKEAQLEERREEAAATRDEAAAKARRAEQARLQAEEQAERAERERAEAAELERRAAEVDPDVDVHHDGVVDRDRDRDPA
jgi:uncharacterized protein HemX